MKQIKFLFTLLASFFVGSAISSSLGNLGVESTTLEMGSAVFVAGNAGSGFLPNGAALSAFAFDDVVAALGDYCRDDANKEDILTSLMLDFVPEDTFQVMDDILDEEPILNFGLGSLVKPGHNPNFQPDPDRLAFGARIIKVRDCKVDLQLVPKEFEKTYLGKYKRKKDDVMEIPFEAFIMDEIKKKIHDELRMFALFRGVYNAAGTSAIDTMTGIDTLLKAERAAVGSPIVPVITGAINSGNVLERLLAVHDALNPAMKNRQTICPLPTAIFDLAIRRMEPVLNNQVVVSSRTTLEGTGLVNSFRLPGTNTICTREPGRGTSQFIYITAKENLRYGTNTASEGNNIRVQEFDRTIKLMIDFKCGVQVGRLVDGMIAMNEQN